MIPRRPCDLCERNRLQRQPKMLSGPLPWWRRMTRWDWLLVALCLAGAAAGFWGMLR